MKQFSQITWNTGRPYTAEGQRIAAVAVDGGVMMADYDRSIEYFFPDCALVRSEVMTRYDANDRCEYSPPNMPMEEFIQLRDALQRAAKAQVKARSNTFDL